MRLSIAILRAAAVIFALTSARAAEAQFGTQGLTVTGEAEIKVAPDQVILTLGVETAGPSLAASKTANDERIRRLMEVVRRFNIDPKLTQTEHLSVEPEYHNRFEPNENVRYMVRRSVTVDLRNIAVFEDLLRAALEAGATHVHSVQFRTTELRKHRDQARLNAVRAATEKAKLLADALGRGLGPATNVYEDSGGWWSSYSSWWGGRYTSMAQNSVQTAPSAPSTADDITAPGQISVTARVTVTFAIQ